MRATIVNRIAKYRLTISKKCVIIEKKEAFQTGEMNMNLRPHHLLCIPHFTGNGYNPAFIAHLTAISSEIRANPKTPVKLVFGCDDLCLMCPHMVDEKCVSAEKTKRMDSAVLRVCGLQSGCSAGWSYLFQTVKQNILQTDAFHEICGNCQWYALCRDTAVCGDI